MYVEKRWGQVAAQAHPFWEASSLAKSPCPRPGAHFIRYRNFVYFDKQFLRD